MAIGYRGMLPTYAKFCFGEANVTDMRKQDRGVLNIESAASPKDRDRTWTFRAIELLQGDRRRSADTHLLNPVFKGLTGLSIYLKDESTHPTGSLKHRLAHSLFLYGICNGNIREGTTVVEASSGSTAVSEAYFAQLLGLPFIAVVPRSTSRAKIEAIERFGGDRGKKIAVELAAALREASV